MAFLSKHAVGCLALLASAVTIGAQGRSDRTLPSLAIIVLGHTDHGSIELQNALKEVFEATGQTVSVREPTSSELLASLEYTTSASRYRLSVCRTNTECLTALSRSKYNGAILTVSAADGPMPGTRDQAQRASKAGIERLVVVLTKLAAVQDHELVDLVELEVRELLNAIGFDADTPIIRDNAMTSMAALLREMDARFARR